jgi:hypothetical protein
MKAVLRWPKITCFGRGPRTAEIIRIERIRAEPNDEKGKRSSTDFIYLFKSKSFDYESTQWLPSLHPPLPSLPLFPQSHPPPSQRTRRRSLANGSKLYTQSSAMIFSPISANTTCRRRPLIIIDGFVHPLYSFLLHYVLNHLIEYGLQRSGW